MKQECNGCEYNIGHDECSYAPYHNGVCFKHKDCKHTKRRYVDIHGFLYAICNECDKADRCDPLDLGDYEGVVE